MAPKSSTLKLGPAICGHVAFAVYATTLSHGVGGGDSGELMGAAAQFGVAHPPGFPTYVLLGWPFAHLPGLSPTIGLHLFSAVAGAISAGLLVYGLLTAGVAFEAAIFAWGIWSFSPLVWAHHTSGEVFALNHAFLAALWCLTVLWQLGRARPFLFGLLAGIGLGNHQILL